MSSSNLGLLYSEGESLSESRLNAKSIFSGTGSEITALPSTKQVPIARCIETGDGFEANELYFQSSDGTSYLNVRRKHLHNADTDVAGGALNDILIANPKQVYVGIPDPRANRFLNYKHASAPAVTDLAQPNDVNYITVQTGTTASQYNNIYLGGIQMGFAKAIYLSLKMQISHETDLVFRTGTGMEWVQDSTANSNKIGLEGCAGTGIYLQVVTGNSLGRTATATTSEMVPASAGRRGYKVYWNPTTADVNYADSDGNVNTVTSTLPSSGAVVGSALFRLGVNTSNTTAKSVLLAGMLLCGEHQDAVML